MKLYDTMSRRSREFTTSGENVKMYVCGITPYDRSHLGHAMSYVIFDVLRRYLEYCGLRVEHVQNYTDIDNRIIARANALGLSYEEVAEQYIQEYVQEMKELNILPAMVYPRATQELGKIIEMISGLIDGGYAYRARGGVYFRVTARKSYGELSGRDLGEMMAGARIEPEAEKEHPMDFALWKAAKPGEPSWSSPWGAGRPGWHIECSAMALRYLGSTLDIHGGGADLVFPHHENEIAQSEGFTGVKPFARFWVHHGWLAMDGEKMSKSLGNIITVREGLDRYGADALRLFILTSHYRSPLAYSEDGLEAAKRGVERLRNALSLVASSSGKVVEVDPHRRRFLDAMEDNLNTAAALASLFDLAREINRGRDDGMDVTGAQSTLRELAGVLGLTMREPESDLAARPFVDLLVEVREELRTVRSYDLADLVRSRLAELGVVLEDTADGTKWHRQ